MLGSFILIDLTSRNKDLWKIRIHCNTKSCSSLMHSLSRFLCPYLRHARWLDDLPSHFAGKTALFIFRTTNNKDTFTWQTYKSRVVHRLCISEYCGSTKLFIFQRSVLKDLELWRWKRSWGWRMKFEQAFVLFHWLQRESHFFYRLAYRAMRRVEFCNWARESTYSRYMVGNFILWVLTERIPTTIICWNWRSCSSRRSSRSTAWNSLNYYSGSIEIITEIVRMTGGVCCWWSTWRKYWTDIIIFRRFLIRLIITLISHSLRILIWLFARGYSSSGCNLVSSSGCTSAHKEIFFSRRRIEHICMKVIFIFNHVKRILILEELILHLDELSFLLSCSVSFF